MLSTQPYKGARDFYPDDKRNQKYMFSVLRRVVESFGYLEYDAPIIEPIEIYLSKTSEEIVAEQTYNFLDRSGRHVTLRPEMTPTVARMVAAKRQHLSYPLRWYSIPNLWRYERPQHGRLREHWQLNVDLFGVSGIEGDHEIILIADSLLRAFGAKRDMYEIRVNSRAFVNWLLLGYLRLDYSQSLAVIRAIDRMKKISQRDFKTTIETLLSPQQREANAYERLAELLKADKISDLPLVTQQHPAITGINNLMELLSVNNVSNVVFDPSLMRGFDYYNNVVFEVFDKHPENNRSLFGGGRYDNLVSEFGVDPIPTVGFGMGDVTLMDFLQVNKLLPSIRVETDAVVILIGDVYKNAQKTLMRFREEGLRLTVDNTGRKVDAQIKSAVKAGINFAIFIGEQELTEQRFKLKDLSTGNEKTYSFERVVADLAAKHPRGGYL